MSKRPIYYDTETTGIHPGKERIVEIAAFDPMSGKTFEELVNPGIPIPKEASAVHKISDEMVMNAENFASVGQKFVEFCSGDVVLIAHNNDSFDYPFLQQEFSRNKITPPCWETFDTLKWARRYRADLPRHTLQFLREIYDIPANNAHRALDDVVVLHRITQYMLDDLSIEEAIALLKIERKLTTMPFGKHQGKPLDKIPKSYVTWLAESGALDKEENKQLKAIFTELGHL